MVYFEDAEKVYIINRYSHHRQTHPGLSHSKMCSFIVNDLSLAKSKSLSCVEDIPREMLHKNIINCINTLKYNLYTSKKKKTKTNNRCSTTSSWTPEQDLLLKSTLDLHANKDWKKIAQTMDFLCVRSEKDCLNRWSFLLGDVYGKKKWTFEEDEAVKAAAMKTFGRTRWSFLVPGRSGHECQQRWVNHLFIELKNKKKRTREELFMSNPESALMATKRAKIAKVAFTLPHQLSFEKRSFELFKEERRLHGEENIWGETPSGVDILLQGINKQQYDEECVASICEM